jgi:hypothetical protein
MTKNKQAAAAPTAPAPAGYSKIVHAYRRLPYMVGEPAKEQPVEVQCASEKILFKSNEAGHIVGTVTTPAAFQRLTEEIPEAYIEYAGGENIPARKTDEPVAPVGEFILTNGTEVKVLDDLTDDELRAFAATAGLGNEQLPDVLTGDTLKKAIFNLLKTGD